MDPNTFPTKGNLILAKNSLKLSRQGYELMDKKRNILIREMMDLIDQAKDIQTQIDVTFRAAYAALQKANMEIGIAFVQQIACTVPIENSIRIKTRSVMGTEIPLVEYNKTSNTPTYAYYSTKMSLDEAKAAFEKVKELSIRLSMVENAAIRLAANIKKTQKRANALKNITIPGSVTKIGEDAFSYCQNLKKATLHEGVKKISKDAFSNTALEEITIPSTVTELGKNAFRWESTEKSSLKKVVIRSQNIKKWGTMVFGATRDDLVIYVPQSKKAEYEKILRSTNGLDFHAKIVGKKW